MAAQIVSTPGVRVSGSDPIVVSGKSFALNGDNVSYRFHVDEETGDLISDHFAGRVTENPPALVGPNGGGWSTQAHIRREFPDLGRGDFGIPAVQIRQSAGYTTCDFKYKSHTITDGKPALDGLPHTYGVKEGDVKTLVLHLYDSHSSVAADLYYSVFPKHDAIVRSVKITNEGSEQIVVMRLASLSIDLPSTDYDMIGLHGEWTRERSRNRRKIQPGIQGFSSATGYSSHYHNPFLSVVASSTTETHGDAWGLALVYTGSFSAEVEQNPQGLTRAMMGMNSNQFSWPLKKGESLTSPECISVYSNNGTGGMSRKYHRLMREHLIRSKFVNETRPVLLNSWEGLYFNFDESTIYKLAQESAKLGAKLFVLDDGWFGVKYPRVDDTTGLGDWVVNPDRFPDGLGPLVEKVRNLKVAGSDEKLQFGLWVEPEMVSPKSALYDEHPDWAMFAGTYPRTEARSQLVLNLGLKEVQDYIIDSMSDILNSAPITYIKWDNNRAIHENSSPDGFHLYMLGLYRVLEELTARFPNVLWEGCASGGGRFDAGMLYYWPQIWTSDNMDPLDRLQIQFGTSLAYPASTMGAHIAAVPNDVTGRTTPMTFRAHVAMMGGSFGLELNPDKMPEDDKALIPDLIALAEKINPIVIKGDLWRLNLPENSNYPAAMYVSEDGSKAVLFAFQIRRITVMNLPVLRLQGLDPSATYSLDGKDRFSGETLMNGGIQYRFNKDFDSKVILIERV